MDSHIPSSRFAVTLDRPDEGIFSLSSARSSESDVSTRFRAGEIADYAPAYDGENSSRTPLRSPLDRDVLGHKAPTLLTETLRRRAHNSPYAAEIDKEAIEIPQPRQRRISGVERLLATVMSPGNRRTAQIHGLVGKPLL